jgi:hypothetical protein
MNLVRLLVKTGRLEEALGAIDAASKVADNLEKQEKTSEVRAKIELKLRD